MAGGEARKLAMRVRMRLRACAVRQGVHSRHSLRAATDGDEEQAMLLRSDEQRVQGGEGREERREATRILGSRLRRPVADPSAPQLVSCLSTAGGCRMIRISATKSRSVATP